MPLSPESFPVIRSLAEIEEIERVPLSARDIPSNTYEAIAATARAHPQTLAIRFVENGDAWRRDREAGLAGLTRDLTYADLLGLINQTANLFRTLGVQRTEVVSMLLPNLPEAYGVLWAGEAAGIVNPINYLLEAEEIGHIIQSARSRVLVIMGEHPDVDIFGKLVTIRKHAPCVEHVVVVGIGANRDNAYLDFASAIATQRADALEFILEAGPDTVASLFHTGGSTGLPKLAQHTHLNEVYTGWILNSLFRYKVGETTLVGLPLFHCNAAIASGLSAFMAGATVLMTGLHGYRSPGIVDNLFHIIEAYKAISFTAVPTIYARLVQLPIEGCDLTSLRLPTCGAAPMPVQLFHSFEDKVGVRVSEGYGLTEATVCSTACPIESDPPRIGSIGIRLPYTRVKTGILDSDGHFVRECNVDEIGTILISGPAATPGYTDESKNGSLFITDDEGVRWVNTGDLARKDVDGFFWLTGRSKELIIRGGHNIDPKSIEEVLATHPAVNLAAAVGRPDPYAGEVPVAYVDTVAKTSEADLIAWCRARIGERAAIPKAILILDKLPVTGVGKIHKPTLNLLEIKGVVERELAGIGDAIMWAEVEAIADPKMGSTAIAKLTPGSISDRAAIEAAVRNALDRYSFHYLIEFVA
jgi:fatty-acyl-CoA synthase